MTLRKLINQNILYGNANIAQSTSQQHKCNAGKTCEGCSCVSLHPLVKINRNYGKLTIDAIIKAGGEKYLDCKVTAVYAFKENKIGIEIELPTTN